ncbi:MAG: metalloregulator ArsR/SmtB family transcription factor [Solobacterium sp.]|nr:metalloregulator ArsR/SmtB family transcription factor [Solobacterium sp.]
MKNELKLVDPEKVEECRKAMICEDDYDDMSMIFTMFADSTRLKIMNALFTNELCVGDLSALIEMSPSAVSHQLASLKKVKLVRTKKIGKLVYYSMADEHIANIYKMAYEHITEDR